MGGIGFLGPILYKLIVLDTLTYMSPHERFGSNHLEQPKMGGIGFLGPVLYKLIVLDTLTYMSPHERFVSNHLERTITK